jgi:hypothetical protein
MLGSSDSCCASRFGKSLSAKTSDCEYKFQQVVDVTLIEGLLVQKPLKFFATQLNVRRRPTDGGVE